MTCIAPNCCTHNCRQGRDCPHRRLSAPRNFALLCIILVVFAGLLAYVGPAIDDHSEEQAQAADALQQIKRERREAMAARAICGENAAYQFTGNTLQCFLHTGKKTISAKVTP